MKYNLFINQKALIDSGIKLKIDEYLILSFCYDWFNNDKSYKVEFCGEIFTWIKHSMICDALPILGYAKDTIYRKMKFFTDNGFFEKHPDGQKLGQSLYKPTELFKKIPFGNLSEPYGQTSVPPTDEHPNPYGQTSVPPTDEHPNNNNIIYNNNKDYNIIYNNANSEFQNSQACEPVCEFLENVIFEYNLNELEKFTKQPKQSFFTGKIKDNGEHFVISVLQKINQHCLKNTDYTKNRKSLSSVFSTFAKNHDTKLTTDVKKVIDEIYTDLFGEKYEYQKSDNKHLFELIKKVKQSIKKYNNGIDPTDEEISLGIKMMLQKIPTEYHNASKFKLPLINTNYQQIKLSIKNNNHGLSKNQEKHADYLRRVADF